MAVRFIQRGNFKNTEDFFKRVKNPNYRTVLDKYGRAGVDALEAATPVDRGMTRDSWDYEIVKTKSGFSINWINSNLKEGVPIAILIQYGHGTSSGSFVEGRDFINPAMKPIFYKLASDLWKEVSNS